MSSRLSGLQRDVLALYRSLLRAARFKEKVGGDADKKTMSQLVTREFRAQASNVGRTDFRLIEHRIRHGYKLKKMMEMPGFRVASVMAKEPQGL